MLNNNRRRACTLIILFFTLATPMASAQPPDPRFYIDPSLGAAAVGDGDPEFRGKIAVGYILGQNIRLTPEIQITNSGHYGANLGWMFNSRPFSWKPAIGIAYSPQGYTEYAKNPTRRIAQTYSLKIIYGGGGFELEYISSREINGTIILNFYQIWRFLE